MSNVSESFQLDVLVSPSGFRARRGGQHIWLVSFMDYDLGYFHLETRLLEPLANPFGPKVLPMSQVRCVIHVSGLDPERSGRPLCHTFEPLLQRAIRLRACLKR